MSYVWEEDFYATNTVPTAPKASWHLKKLIPAKDPMATAPFSLMTGPYKQTVAWVHKTGERKYEVRLLKHAYNWKGNDKTFRSLKAAKAYALAVVALDQ